MMAFDNTITQKDLDASAQNAAHGFGGNALDVEPDLAVDGLSESVLSRLLGLLGVGRSRH